MLGKFLTSVSSGFVTAQQQAEFNAFFTEHHPAAAAQALRQAQEAVAAKLAWAARDGEGLEAFLRAELASGRGGGSSLLPAAKRARMAYQVAGGCY